MELWTWMCVYTLPAALTDRTWSSPWPLGSDSWCVAPCVVWRCQWHDDKWHDAWWRGQFRGTELRWTFGFCSRASSWVQLPVSVTSISVSGPVVVCRWLLLQLLYSRWRTRAPRRVSTMTCRDDVRTFNDWEAATTWELMETICLGGCIGWALDSWSKGRWFDSRSGRYQVN